MAREFTDQQAIRNLQKYLRQLSFFDQTFPEVPIDGIYASETREAVEIFQEKHGLAVTGEADRETWDAIFSVYRTSVDQHSKPVPIDLFYRTPTPGYIREGDGGFHVSAVQYMLNEILLFYGNTEEITIDGNYSEQTSDGVKQFQKYINLPQTGEVDRETWDRLAMFHNEQFRRSNQS